MNWLTHPEPEPDTERLRTHEADFTPLPVIRQVLREAADFCEWNGHPQTVCDPAAGAGAWCQVMREMWDPEIVAVEKRPEEFENIERHADEVHVGDAVMWALENPRRHDPRAHFFDVTATNPPFSLFADYADAFMSISHDVWLFAPVDAMLRGEEASAWLKVNAKWVRGCLWVPGGISFRAEPGQDFRQYGLWMLSGRPTPDPAGWPVRLLERLPGTDRKWVTRPGTGAV